MSRIMSIEIEDSSNIDGRYLMLIHILLNMVIVIYAMYGIFCIKFLEDVFFYF